MKSLVIALTFCAATAMTGIAAAGCDGHGSLDAKAPPQDKAVLAQATVKPKAASTVTTKTDAQVEAKAAITKAAITKATITKAAVRAETRRSITL